MKPNKLTNISLIIDIYSHTISLINSLLKIGFYTFILNYKKGVKLWKKYF